MLGPVDRPPPTLRDAAYVAVGFAVLAVQRAQVRRRELSRRLRDLEEFLPPAARDALDALRHGPPPPVA